MINWFFWFTPLLRENRSLSRHQQESSPRFTRFRFHEPFSAVGFGLGDFVGCSVVVFMAHSVMKLIVWFLFISVWTKIYPPTQASTVTSTDCLYLCDACTLRVVHIISHTPPSPQTRLWDVFQRWCHAPPNQDAWWWGRWAWATAPTVWRLTFFPGSTRMPPQLPHPCMPPVAAMLLFCTAPLPVTCPVPPTACHMPCDPIPRSFSTLGVGLITCVNQNLPTHTSEHSHFNRLPLPMWRVHLKGCAHHLTQ